MTNKNISKILKKIENNIQNQEELNYFWTHAERYRFILQKIVETQHIASLQQKRVLDIGCYPYHLGQALEDLGFEVSGISSEHEPVKGNPKIVSINIETDKFTFPDNYFDLVLCTEVLEHLIRTPAIPLREIKRILKPNGIVIITTPNVFRSINRFSLLIGRSVYPHVKDYYDEKVGEASFYFRHNKEYTMAEMEELIINSGLKIKHEEYFISYTPFRKRQIPDHPLLKFGKYANYFLMQTLPSWRDTLYFEMGK